MADIEFRRGLNFRPVNSETSGRVPQTEVLRWSTANNRFCDDEQILVFRLILYIQEIDGWLAPELRIEF